MHDVARGLVVGAASPDIDRMVKAPAGPPGGVDAREVAGDLIGDSLAFASVVMDDSCPKIALGFVNACVYNWLQTEGDDALNAFTPYKGGMPRCREHHSVSLGCEKFSP